MEKNKNVCLAIYEKYDGFHNLKGIQVIGKADMIEPFSDEYNAHTKYKGIPLDALKKSVVSEIAFTKASPEFIMTLAMTDKATPKDSTTTPMTIINSRKG